MPAPGDQPPSAPHSRSGHSRRVPWPPVPGVVARGGEIEQQGGRKRRSKRLGDVSSPIEETYWTAKEWAMRTRIPYRTILSAASRGELAAVRPSGTAHGTILISESSWDAWIERVRMRVSASDRIPRSARRPSRSLSELALS
jgi:hypothetical protein